MVSSPAAGRRLLGNYDYPVSHRLLELIAFSAFLGFGGVFIARVVRALADHHDGVTVAWSIAAAVGGFLLADLMSGLVHFACDKLGSPETPVIGQKFIKPFRDHHDDPKAMTIGDFVAVNSDNLLLCLIVLVPAVVWLDVVRHVQAGAFLVSFVTFVAITNQVHKWAHMEHVPRLVSALQRAHIILPVDHHQVHHTDPYDDQFCITSGLLNPVMRRFNMWKRLQGQH